MSTRETFRPRSALASGAIIFITSLVLIIQSFMYERGIAILQTIFWSLLASQIAYAIFIRPKVIFFTEGLTLHNPFTTVSFGWNDVEEVEGKYSMSILYLGKHFYAWAAPAPGRYHAQSIHPSEIRGMKINDASMIRPGESPRTHSGVAVDIARRYWQDFRNANIQGIEFNETFARIPFIFVCVNFIICIAVTINHS
jgi:hypothetical protein